MMNIPATPNYLSFLQSADNIDDLGQWLGGGIVTGIYEFQPSEDMEPIILTDIDETQFVAPNLAAKGAKDNYPQPYKFLCTSDGKVLCQKR